jgi:alpha-N-acetylglucosamine transferase
MRRLLKNAPPDKKERLEANLLVVLPVELTLNESIKSAVE